MPKNIEIRNSTAEFLIFMLEGKEDGIQVMYKNETIWATQKAMAQLFDCSTDNIGLHLKNIFASGELVKGSVTEKTRQLPQTGRIIKRCSIILMPLSVLDIESILFVPPSSDSGVRLCFVSLLSVVMCLITREWRTGLS